MSELSWKEQVALKKAEKLNAKAKGNATVAQKISTTGWDMQGNALLFKLKVSDPTVAYYLAKKPQTGLARAQSSDAYKFEFHPMHTTGNPIYIRMDDSDDNSKIPKFDTKNKTAPEFVNSKKITLSETDYTALTLLITDNWDFLSYMAEQVYKVDKII